MRINLVVLSRLFEAVRLFHGVLVSSWNWVVVVVIGFDGTVGLSERKRRHKKRGGLFAFSEVFVFVCVCDVCVACV